MMNVITFQQFSRIVEMQTTDERIFTIKFQWSDSAADYPYTIHELVNGDQKLRHKGATTEFAATVDVEKILLQYLIKENKTL